MIIMTIVAMMMKVMIMMIDIDTSSQCTGDDVGGDDDEQVAYHPRRCGSQIRCHACFQICLMVSDDDYDDNDDNGHGDWSS